jgi:DNA-binding MarR family transcriptional regulator
LLESYELIVKRSDLRDKRRTFVQLSEVGLNYMRHTLTAMSDKMRPPLFSP